MKAKRLMRLSGGESPEERAVRLAAIAHPNWLPAMPAKCLQARVSFVAGYMAAAQDWCEGPAPRRKR